MACGKAVCICIHNCNRKTLLSSGIFAIISAGQEAGKELEALAKKYNLSHGAQIVIEKFVKMNESERQILLNYYTEIATALTASHYPEKIKAFPNNDLDKLSIDEKVELYRQKLEREEKEAEISKALPKNV